MPYPSKFISSSDYSSTPLPLSGGRTLVLNTPAEVQVRGMGTVNYSTSVTIDGDFDTVSFILTCDQYPDINVYNGYIQISEVAEFWASVEISGNKVRLIGTYTCFWDEVFHQALTIRATIIPIKSPFSQ
jgi:hypothetical protein